MPTGIEYYKLICMNDTSNHENYISINPVTAAVELNLPERYKQYSDDLKAEIVRKFSFANLNHELEKEIQSFIEEYLQTMEQQ